MTTWAEAHRVGIVAATRLLKKHRIDPVERVPVLEIADREDIVVKFAPLPHLAGAYTHEDGSLPGIMVNNKLPLAKQRYTLGHELGHHFFKHATSLDTEIDFFDPAQGQSAVPDHEKVAEAFAAWLLMPRSHIEASMKLLGIGTVSRPRDAYELALLAGTSYRAMCVHLVSLKVLDQARANVLLKVQPKAIKRQLLDGTGLPSGASDVVVLGPRDDGRTVHVASGDVLLLRDEPGSSTSLDSTLPDFVVAKTSGDRSEVQALVVGALDIENPVRASSSASLVATSEGGRWSVTLVANHPLTGVSERWFE